MIKRKFCDWIWLFLLSSPVMAQSSNAIIDSLVIRTLQKPSVEQYTQYCFTIADNYMELDLYDSAQLWLNKIAEKLPLRKPTIANYFLSTRQAEVYYYNGLQRLGLQESRRSLAIAQALNDSLLLADSYNFIGLFYINLDSARAAIPYLRKGALFARQPPYPDNYLHLSKPHHLYGNLAEAYEKIGIYDSAAYYSRISLQLASQINWLRGMAVASFNLGNAYLKTGMTDSAVSCFFAAATTAATSQDVDVELIAYGGLAQAENHRQFTAAALQWLYKGEALIDSFPTINTLFTNQFLDQAIAIYRQHGQTGSLLAAISVKNRLLQKQIARNNRQINVILNAGLQNETRLLNLEVKEVRQRSEIANARVYLLIAVLVLVTAGFIFYRYKSNQRLKLARLQNKISQDLHDDVGSSLSSLQVYSTVADKLLEKEPQRAKEMLRKISLETATVMENIDDIIWSIKPEKEHSLEQRVKNFVSGVLNASNMKYTIFIEDGIEEHLRSIEARKNILLLIKEAVNNCVKHSRADYVSVSIKKLAGQLSIQVVDDGVGFERSVQRKKGDGLSNMERRTLEMGGIYELLSHPDKGTTVSALIPFTKISDDR